jgi:CRISPR-associated protein Cmr4
MSYLITETPMLPGTGTIINSPVDLPVQRERHTDFPLIQSASIKGVLKTNAMQLIDENNTKVFEDGEIDIIFGPEVGEKGASCISISDARILAFPVRSLVGIFGWITCPLILNRYKRDLKLVGTETNWTIPEFEKEDKTTQESENGEMAIVATNSNLWVDKINEPKESNSTAEI